VLLIPRDARVFDLTVAAEDKGKGTSPEADTFLKSLTLIPKAPVRPGGPGPDARGKDPTILGGASDPAFKGVATEGGLFIGFEIGLGKFLGRDMIRAVRPIDRAGGKEAFGERRGTQ
jgi:hypothetical protein